MNKTKGQVGTEYLFVLAGVIVVSVIATIMTLNLINSEINGPSTDWNKFESKYAKLNIISIIDDDEHEYKVKDKPFGGYSFLRVDTDKMKVKFEIVENAQDYNVFFKQDGKQICGLFNQGSIIKGTITSKSISINGCTSMVLGKPIDVVVTVRYSEIRSETDMEKNFMKFT
jgi:hypothetical protein